MLLAGRLDLLALGDDAASVLGLNVRRTRMTTMLVAVLLSAAAVTLAGPIGFVGLSAPVIVRLVGRRVPVLLRHRWLLPASMVTGVVVVVGSDVLLRTVFGPMAGVTVPTGVPTSILGAALLVALARGYRAGNGSRAQWPVTRVATPRRVVVTLVVIVALLVGAVVAGMLLGDTKVLLGDVTNWLAGRTGPALTFVLDTRLPRVLAALVGGAALAVAGVAVQAVCRNPLAEPGLVGATAGAGFAAVCVVTWVPLAGAGLMTVAAAVGATAAFALVLGLSWQRGLDSDRVVLMGIGVAAAMSALTTLVIVLTDPWNTGKVLTWLSGSTWGRTLDHVWPVAVALLVIGPTMWLLHRRMDLVVIDDDTPRLLGVPLERTRLMLLAMAAILVATRSPRSASSSSSGSWRRTWPEPSSAAGTRWSCRWPRGWEHCWSAWPTPSAARSSRPPRSRRAWSRPSSAPRTSSGCSGDHERSRHDPHDHTAHHRRPLAPVPDGRRRRRGPLPEPAPDPVRRVGGRAFRGPRARPADQAAHRCRPVDLDATDDWYAAWLGLPDEVRPAMRTYTTRRVTHTAAGSSVDVDMVVHDDAGPAGDWAARAEVGDEAMLVGPDRRFEGDPGGRAFALPGRGARGAPGGGRDRPARGRADPRGPRRRRRARAEGDGAGRGARPPPTASTSSPRTAPRWSGWSGPAGRTASPWTGPSGRGPWWRPVRGPGASAEIEARPTRTSCCGRCRRPTRRPRDPPARRVRLGRGRAGGGPRRSGGTCWARSASAVPRSP